MFSEHVYASGIMLNVYMYTVIVAYCL